MDIWATSTSHLLNILPPHKKSAPKSLKIGQFLSVIEPHRAESNGKLT